MPFTPNCYEALVKLTGSEQSLAADLPAELAARFAELGDVQIVPAFVEVAERGYAWAWAEPSDFGLDAFAALRDVCLICQREHWNGMGPAGDEDSRGARMAAAFDQLVQLYPMGGDAPPPHDQYLPADPE